MTSRLRLRLLVPSIAMIVVATMIPAGLRHPSLRYIQDKFDPPDFLNNILLYMPLGIALSGTSLVRTFCSGFALSTVAEVLQMGYIDRIPSPLDVASNTCGSLVGYLLAVLFRRATGGDPRALRIPRPLAGVAILIAILGTIGLVRKPPSSDLSNWSPEYHLVLGNDVNGQRPWAGTISAWQIYPFAMTPAQISGLARQPHIDLPSGLVPPGSKRLSRDEELKLYHALVSRNQLTLLVAMRPANVEQTGPARIITYSSRQMYGRNFTLGQMHDTLTFRLRTPASGGDGTNPALYTGPVLSPNRTSFVAAVYDGRVSSLYVDGKLAAHADLAARRPHLPRHVFAWLPRSVPIREIELGGSEALLSGLLAIGIFSFAGVPRRLSIRFLAGALAGAAVGGAIWIFGVSAPRLGTRLLLECIGAGLVIAASVDDQETIESRAGF